jgi:hypothetical protein
VIMCPARRLAGNISEGNKTVESLFHLLEEQ